MGASPLKIDIDNSCSACYPIEAVVQGRGMRRARTWCCNKYRPQSGEEVRKTKHDCQNSLKTYGYEEDAQLPCSRCRFAFSARRPHHRKSWLVQSAGGTVHHQN